MNATIEVAANVAEELEQSNKKSDKKGKQTTDKKQTRRVG